MFYRTTEDHGLPHNPFNAIVVPRPIGWISTISERGLVNLAPYSFFNAVAYTPPQVMFSAGRRGNGDLKDTVVNVRETGEFVVNLATWDLREQVSASSVPAPPDVDEFVYAGLTPTDSELVKPPRVAESPVHLECVFTQTVELLTEESEEPSVVVFGKVVGIHIADRAIVDGKVDTAGLQPIGRLGYDEYVRVTETFSMDRPTWP